MQAIITKYLGPTDRRGSRVKAIADAGSITIAWDYALSVEQNHDAAALALTRKFGWDAEGYGHSLVRGGMPMTTPYAYCYVQVGGRTGEYDQVPMKQHCPQCAEGGGYPDRSQLADHAAGKHGMENKS